MTGGKAASPSAPNTRERVRNRRSRPLSRLNMPPLPGTTSRMSWVCFPDRELRPRDPDLGPVDLAELHIRLADAKISHRIAHRRGAVAAPARLVEQHVAVIRTDVREQSPRGLGGGDAGAGPVVRITRRHRAADDRGGVGHGRDPETKRERGTPGHKGEPRREGRMSEAGGNFGHPALWQSACLRRSRAPWGCS